LSNEALAYQPQEERILPNQDAENDYRTIGEIAEEFNVTLRTLRFYESKGLIKPRREGTTRLYGEEDRARLALILQGKRLGFTLTEIRGMLASYREHGGRRFLNLSREQCREQIEMLERQKTEIEEALTELRRTYAALHDGAAEPGDSRA
jgi:DNA-binding transcriptional MerR regulator